jgi:hypothetical protein
MLLRPRPCGRHHETIHASKGATGVGCPEQRTRP